MPKERELLEKKVESLNKMVSQLVTRNSELVDELITLKHNYDQLVEDVNQRFKVVHEKVFR